MRVLAAPSDSVCGPPAPLCVLNAVGRVSQDLAQYAHCVMTQPPSWSSFRPFTHTHTHTLTHSGHSHILTHTYSRTHTYSHTLTDTHRHSHTHTTDGVTHTSTSLVALCTRTSTVGGTRTSTVGGTRTSTVGSTRTSTVGGTRTSTVGGTRTSTVGGTRTSTALVALQHSSFSHYPTVDRLPPLRRAESPSFCCCF
jgi:hypothetical protein